MTERALLWIGVWGMALGAIALLATGPKQTKDAYFHRTLHSFVPMVAGGFYLLMALGQGALYLDGGREFLYARYIDWSVTTPLLLLALSATALGELRTRPGLMVALVGADVYMILAGLAAGLSPAGSVAKWTWYIVSCGAFLGVYYVLWGPLLKEAKARSAEAAKAYISHAAILSVLWFLYPVVFILGPDGMGMIRPAISPALATLFFVVLDLATKVVYAFVTYASIRKVSDASPAHSQRTVLAT